MIYMGFTADILPQDSLLYRASRHTECVQEPLWNGKTETKFDNQPNSRTFTVCADSMNWTCEKAEMKLKKQAGSLTGQSTVHSRVSVSPTTICP